MKKSILDLGKILTKEKQKQINGGKGRCSTTFVCDSMTICSDGDKCAYIFSDGEITYGTVQNEICCQQ